jgi:hypothetical protein
MVTETEVAEVLETMKKTPAKKTAPKKPKAPVVKKSPVAKKPKAEVKKPAHTALPKIARAMGIDPKSARAKLRKLHGPAWKSLSDDELRTLIAA